LQKFQTAKVTFNITQVIGNHAIRYAIHDFRSKISLPPGSKVIIDIVPHLTHLFEFVTAVHFLGQWYTAIKYRCKKKYAKKSATSGQGYGM